MPKDKGTWVAVGKCPGCGKTLEGKLPVPLFTRHAGTKKESCEKTK